MVVPNSTGAAKAIGLVIPELNGKLIGAAQRVPTPTGSTTLLFAVVDKKVTKEEINAAMKAAQTESFGYNEDEIVSSDIVGMRYGSLFDATQATLFLPLFLRDEIPQEHKDCIDMAREYLRRASCAGGLRRHRE